MSDPIEAMMNSPRTIKAMENLNYTMDDVKSVSKEQFKAKLGDMKISRQELDEHYKTYEDARRNKINEILKVSWRPTM